MLTMFRKSRILSAPDRTRHQALHGIPYYEAPRSMAFPGNRSRHYSDGLGAVVDGMTFSNQSGCEETAIGRNTHGVKDSPVPLLQVDDPESSIRRKTLKPHPAL